MYNNNNNNDDDLISYYIAMRNEWGGGRKEKGEGGGKIGLSAPLRSRWLSSPCPGDALISCYYHRLVSVRFLSLSPLYTMGMDSLCAGSLLIFRSFSLSVCECCAVTLSIPFPFAPSSTPRICHSYPLPHHLPLSSPFSFDLASPLLHP